MKVYIAHDGKLRVRIGRESLGSESLGPWYGGTGAIRLRQVIDGWFRAYRCRQPPGLPRRPMAHGSGQRLGGMSP